MDTNLTNSLGFFWDRGALPSTVPVHSVDRACFRFSRMLAEYVWDASMLEGNPFTFPEVKTLLDGITVGGRRVSDQEQVLNLAESAKRLLALVKSGNFALTKETFTDLHRIVARNEALEWGAFRGEGQEGSLTPDVSLGSYGRYTPLPTIKGGKNLDQKFVQGLSALNAIAHPFERALAFFLFGALQQFFFDGNKRTARMMMNGILMSNGMDAISIPAARAQEFNEQMVEFYLNRDGTGMMRFMASCHPDAQQIARTNHHAAEPPLPTPPLPIK